MCGGVGGQDNSPKSRDFGSNALNRVRDLGLCRWGVEIETNPIPNKPKITKSGLEKQIHLPSHLSRPWIDKKVFLKN